MGEKCKVLIVEDELITHQAIKYILGPYQDKYEIVGEAFNGEEAIEMIKVQKPHIILTDITMPVMDGIELTKWVKHRFPDTYVVILSSYGDFEYVKACFKHGAYEYILKPKLEPQTLIQLFDCISKECNIEGYDVKEEIQSESVLLHQCLDKENTQLAYIKGTYDKPFFMAIGCQISKIKGYSKGKEKVYYKAIVEMLKSYFGSTLVEHVLTEEHYIICLLNLDEQCSIQWDREKEQRAYHIANQFEGLKIAYSRLMDSTEYLKEEIDELQALIGKQFFVEEEVHSYSYETVRKGMCTAPHFSQGTYRRKLEIGLYQEAFELLETWVQHPCLVAYTTEAELKKTVEHAMYTALSAIEEGIAEGRNSGLDKLQVLNTVSHCHTISALKTYLSRIVVDIEKYNLYSKKDEQTTIVKVCQYIDEHAHEQLTLQEVAKVFHMSYSYLSTYFSSETNKGFNEYLNARRTDKAKYLLCHSDIPIASIGEKVGYIDQSYFSKVFKKNTGESPSGYRRKYRE